MILFGNCPVNKLIRIYRIYPKPTPVNIEYVKGISNNTKKAGIASSGEDHLILLVFINKVNPTNNSKGDVPAAGIFSNTGHKNTEILNKIPHTKVLNPVFAPALIPNIIINTYI